MISARCLTRAAAIALAVLLLHPVAASACPVCFNAREEARIAYIVTAGLLTLLPFALVGGFAAYVRARSRERDREDAVLSDCPPPRVAT